MCLAPEFLPPTLNLDTERDRTLAMLYDVFKRDFKETQTYHRGKSVRYNSKIGDASGKEEGFWHIVSKYDISSGERLIDYPRAKRLPWAKPLMESDEREEIVVWQYKEGASDKGLRTYIWLENYDYLLILQLRKQVYYWVTAFYIESNWKKRDLRRKYEKRI